MSLELNAMLAELIRKSLREEHGDEHKFEPHPLDRAVCVHCGWYSHDGPPLCILGHTARDHAAMLLKALEERELVVAVSGLFNLFAPAILTISSHGRPIAIIVLPLTGFNPWL